MKLNNQIHIPVLKDEVINIISPKKNGTYLDCTAGYGGHSSLILKSMLNTGKLFCIDQDQNAISFLNEKFKNSDCVSIIKCNFQDIKKNINNTKFDGILLDIGVSSHMFDDPIRGFSYRFDGPLDMRMDTNSKFKAWDIINVYDFEELNRVFRDYGDLPNQKRVINAIIDTRKIKTIDSTLELVEIIKSNINKSMLYKKQHPAKKFFQALRIEVNDELNVLKNAIVDCSTLLKKDGTLAIITFQSLEDRIVKKMFNNLTLDYDEFPINIPKTKIITSDFINLTKKPILPSEEEIIENNRSHSAKLRAIKRK